MSQVDDESIACKKDEEVSSLILLAGGCEKRARLLKGFSSSGPHVGNK